MERKEKVTLERGGVCSTWAFGKHLSILCKRGEIWITQQGDMLDYIVADGGGIPFRRLRPGSG